MGTAAAGMGASTYGSINRGPLRETHNSIYQDN